MIIGRQDGNRELLKYGHLNLAHLAIWTKALSPSEISIAYSSHVTEDNAAILCCYKIKGKSLNFWLRIKVISLFYYRFGNIYELLFRSLCLFHIVLVST